MQEIVELFPMHLRGDIELSGIFDGSLEELRIRIGQPVLAWTTSGEKEIKRIKDYRITKEDMGKMVSYISKCSLYAFEEEIKKGYLTLDGGHRVGLGGQVVMENGQIRTIRPITYLNIRIAHQVPECARTLVDSLFHKKRCGNILIMSAPGIGKTTILRDLIRIISDEQYKVGIVDERSELAGCHSGIPQNEIGLRTDVLDGCPKAIGMMMLVRSMSPEYLAVDEIGNSEDIRAIRYAVNCGCGILATIHCPDIESLKQKPVWYQDGLSEFFDYYVVLENRRGVRGWSAYNRQLQLIDVSS